MRSDISRQTFNPSKHYDGVVTLQGRVILDADLNEQAAIQRYRAETETIEVIGRTGVPKGATGFQVSPAGGGLVIGKGHIYVDGILCENDQDALPIDSPQNLPGFVMPTANGRYLAYLDAWLRFVSTVEAPDIREKALGGPDTSGRIQVVWQVHLSQVGGSDTCAAFGPTWTPVTASSGKLTATTINPSTGSSACILPPEGGYTGLENQLYRVEIHQLGTLASGNATFKWSRENGSVTAGVSKFNGVELTLADVGQDALLGFENAQWVEISDDLHDLTGQPGELREIELVTPSSMTIKLKVAPSGTYDQANHPKVVRWDQSDISATDTGVALSAGPLLLENGIQVSFADGQYNTGDYWLIPARTATGDAASFIEWPEESGSPAALGALGIRHHYCPLTLLDLASPTWTPVSDCRVPFPPLTAIAASDVSYDPSACADLAGVKTVQQAIDALCARNEADMCTFVVEPKPGWEAIFDKIGQGNSAEVCFQVGDYALDAVKIVDGKGNLSLHGAGPGSRILVKNSEAALLFRNCASVSISDLFAQGSSAGQGQSAAHLNGAFSFNNCASVDLDHVNLKCTGASMETTSCVMIENDDQHAGSVRIWHCDMEVGNQQSGIIVVNTARAQIEDNALKVENVAGKDAVKNLLNDVRYRSLLRKGLLSNIQPQSAVHKIAGPQFNLQDLSKGLRLFRAPAVRLAVNPPQGAAAAPAGANANAAANQSQAARSAAQAQEVNAQVTFGGRTVFFKTDAALAQSWQALVNTIPPKKKLTSDIELGEYLNQLANVILKNEGVVGTINNFLGVYTQLVASNPAIAMHGIVVGGRIATDVRILNNTLSGFIKGIHVGQSIREGPPGSRQMAGAVRINGNTITVTLPSPVKRERHGIFTGNVDTLIVENNRIELSTPGKDDVDGIRIYGQFGRMVIVRQNHLVGFPTGIYIHPLRNLQNPLGANTRPQWLVGDNIAPGANIPVDVEFTPKPGEVNLKTKVRLVENYA